MLRLKNKLKMLTKVCSGLQQPCIKKGCNKVRGNFCVELLPKLTHGLLNTVNLLSILYVIRSYILKEEF